MHNIEPTFDKRSCRYTIERGRESTARVVVWREFDVPRSYTLEASFSGCSLGQLQVRNQFDYLVDSLKRQNMGSPVNCQVYLLSMCLKSVCKKSLYTRKSMCQKSISPKVNVSKVNVSKRQCVKSQGTLKVSFLKT